MKFSNSADNGRQRKQILKEQSLEILSEQSVND